MSNVNVKCKYRSNVPILIQRVEVTSTYPFAYIYKIMYIYLYIMTCQSYALRYICSIKRSGAFLGRSDLRGSLGMELSAGNEDLVVLLLSALTGLKGHLPLLHYHYYLT